MTGLIVKALSGFYYIGEAKTECRASGLLRKNRQTPLVGDMVEYDMLEDGKGYITRIKERRNFLVRPPVANIDLLIIISSAVCPAPNPLIIDKLILTCEIKGIEPVILFNKSDLENMDEYVKIYKNSGFLSFAISCKDNYNIGKVKEIIKNKISVFCGNSGVGKSSLLNILDEGLDIKTAEVSKKLGRGRHTTRHTEFYTPDSKTLVADSPGFSSIETEKMFRIKREDISLYYRDFNDYLGGCRFTSCSHTKEKDCSVIKAVNEGKIENSRFQNYLIFMDEAKKMKKY